MSNHGGRQLDGAIASLDALPSIAAEVDGAVPVLFDSGIRCASDAVVALALGADAVCVGRPYAYGLALAGEDGARAVFEHLRAELDLTMAVAGITTIGEITREVLGQPAGMIGERHPACLTRLRALPEFGHVLSRLASGAQYCPIPPALVPLEGPWGNPHQAGLTDTRTWVSILTCAGR